MAGESVINGVTKIIQQGGYSYLFPVANLFVNTSENTIRYTYYTIGELPTYTIAFSDLLNNRGASDAEEYVDILCAEGAYGNTIAETSGGGTISVAENTILVKEASDLDNVDFTKVYQFDGVVDISDVEIVVPSGSVFELIGNSSDLCGGVSASDNQTFVSGQGQFKYSGLFFTLTGTGSKVFDMDSATASVEGTNTNYYFCTKVGSVNGIRQGLLNNVFWLGCEDGIDFEGTNGGFFNNTLLIRNFNPNDDAGATCFKASPTATFSTRFFSNANIQVDSNSTAYEFIEGNFLSDTLLQLENGNIAGTGTYVDGITEDSVKSSWRNTKGIKSTRIGAIWEMTTPTLISILASDTYQKIDFTTTAKKNTHHSQPSGATIRYLGEEPIFEALTGNLTIRGGSNRQISVDVRINNVSVFEATETTDGNGRARNISLFGYNEILQDEEVEVYIKVDNGSNVTVDRAFLRLNEE